MLDETGFGPFIVEEDEFGLISKLEFGGEELWFFVHTVGGSNLGYFFLDLGVWGICCPEGEHGFSEDGFFIWT